MKELRFGVRELQARLSSALRAVKSGSRVIVTSHDEPVAEIVKPRKPVRRMTAGERRLEKLYASGLLIRRKKPGPIRIRPLRIGGLVEQLLADRR